MDFPCHEAACKHIEIALSRAFLWFPDYYGFSDRELDDFIREAKAKSIPLFILPILL